MLNLPMQADEDEAALERAGETPATESAEPPAGPYQLSDEDLLRRLGLWWKEATDAMKEERPKRTKDWAYYAGRQWEDEDRKIAEKQKRPALTLNMLLSIISAVEGEERTNRQEMKFYGEGAEDDQTAYAMNRILKWIMDQCGGQFSLSKQFRSTIICGEGWVVPEVDYFDDPNGKLKLAYVDDEEMFVDPLSTDETAADARYLHRVRMMSDEELNARWPGSAEKVRQICLENGIGPETDGKGFRDIYSTPNDTASPKLYDAKRKLWAVIETWWAQIEPGWVVVNEQTQLLEERTPDEFEAMKTEREQQQRDWFQSVMMGGVPQPALPGAGSAMTAIPAPDQGGPAVPPFSAQPGPAPLGPMPQPLQAMQRPIRRFYQAFHTFETLLDKTASPLVRLKRFPYVPFRGLWDKIGKEWFGITRPLHDPQRQHNVEQSVIVQLMQLMPKQSWMGPKGSFHDKTKWGESVAQPGSMLEYNAMRGKPEPIPVQAIPRHLIDMAFTRPQTMREISGVNVDLMGQRVASDPGVVMEMRQKAAKTVLAPLFDNFRMSKMALGKVLLAYIQAYITPGRTIRVLGPEGTTDVVTMSQDMSLGDYDLTVEETNATVNDRIATLNILQTTLPQLAKAGMTVPPEIIDLLPMQPHIRDAWKRQIMWELTLAGKLPPPEWQPGMDPRMFLGPPPGGPPGAPPGAPPQAPAAPAPAAQ